jgi:hypothetical protein
MKASKLWKVIILIPSLLLFLFIVESSAQCNECPPDPPCSSCPPDQSVPLDGGAVIILAGAAILGIGKLNVLKKAQNGLRISSCPVKKFTLQ